MCYINKCMPYTQSHLKEVVYIVFFRYDKDDKDWLD